RGRPNDGRADRRGELLIAAFDAGGVLPEIGFGADDLAGAIGNSPVQYRVCQQPQNAVGDIRRVRFDKIGALLVTNDLLVAWQAAQDVWRAARHAFEKRLRQPVGGRNRDANLGQAVIGGHLGVIDLAAEEDVLGQAKLVD